MESLLFTSVPQPQSRWKAFAAGWSAQAIGIAGLLAVSTMLPQTVQQVHRYTTTPLVAYEAPQPKAYQAPRLAAVLKSPGPVVQPAIVLPRAEKIVRQPEVAAPEVKIAAKIPDLPIAPPQPKVMATDTFSAGKADKPTTTKPAEAVQMGGFGDPNGVAARNTQGAVNIAASGFSDLPNGSGRGNGYGGPNAGVVASSGFGAGPAGSHAGAGGGSLQQSGFSGFSSAPAVKKIVASAASTIPVEILSKPVPDYTAEGRELKIDGEVRLEVLFTTSGQAHVIRVIQGLGHGLDEQAVRAAQQIKFKPALHEGQPVDSTAVVHIIFQLVS
jgi:TonB family protein